MATSFRTLHLPSLPIPKYIPYVPPESKSKQRRNAKPKLNPKLSAVEDKQPIDNCPIANQGWTHIDDILDGLSDSGAASSAERERHTPLSNPLAVIDLDSKDVRGNSACLSSTEQIHQPSTDKCGYSLAPGVEETDLVLSNLLGGCSPEFPVVVENDPATANPSTESAECNGTQPPSPVDSLILTTGNRASNVGGGHAATGIDLPSVEGAGDIYNDSMVERNEPLGDLDTANLSSAKCKRKHSPSSYTNSSSPEALDLPSEQHFGEPRSAKRRRSLSQPSKDASSSHMFPSESTFLYAHGATKINNNADECVGASDSLSNDVSSWHDGEVQSDGEEVVDNDGASSQVQASAAVPQPQPRNSHQSQDQMLQDGSSQGGLRDYHGSKRRQKSTTLREHKPPSSPSRGGADTHLTHRRRTSFKAKPRCKKLRSRRRETKGDIAVPAATFPTPPAGNACEVGNRNATDTLGEHSDYQLTDVTHFQVPADASLVTAVVRGDGGMPMLSDDRLETLVLSVFGNKGKLVRMAKLGSNSWLLVGYQCNLHNTQTFSASRSTAQVRRSGSRNRYSRASNTADGSENEADSVDDEDDAFEDGSEGPGDSDSDASDRHGDEGRSSKRDRASHIRTHRPWSKSDEQRLLAYKRKMGMEWAKIFRRFPDRTPGAVRARWYMLRGI